jgi:hypothetical protein
MQRLEVSDAVRPICGSLGVKGIRNIPLRLRKERENSALTYRSETWIPRKEYKVKLKSRPRILHSTSASLKKDH